VFVEHWLLEFDNFLLWSLYWMPAADYVLCLKIKVAGMTAARVVARLSEWRAVMKKRHPADFWLFGA